MKLIKYNQTKINDEKSVPGLVSSQIEYEVKNARGWLEYTGPNGPCVSVCVPAYGNAALP